ncbi:unnamed protein product, partial [Adineta steineri]
KMSEQSGKMEQGQIQATINLKCDGQESKQG